MNMDYNRMKKCDSCGAEIPWDAVYCDVCGTPVAKKVRKDRDEDEGRFRRPKTFKEFMSLVGMCLVMIVGLLILIGVISGYASELRYREYERRRDLSDWEVTVTEEECQKVKVDMTYDEVKEAIGGDGKLIEDEKYWITYRWPGEYYVDSHAGYLEVEFDKHIYGELKGSDPSAESITEHEIMGGKEASETIKLINDSRYSEIGTEYVTRAQLMQLRQGMTYEEACEVLGTEGKLYRSYSHTTKSRTDLYAEYVWKCKYGDRDDYYSQTFEDGILKELRDWKFEYVD